MKITLLGVLGIFFLSLTPLLWFKPGAIITGTDLDFPLFPEERFEERIYTWFPKILGGTDRSNNVSSLPYITTSYIFHLLGFDLIAVQKLTFIFWYFLVGLSMYFLASIIFSKEKPLIPFFSAILYMFNFYQIFIWTRLQLALPVLVLFPVFLGVLIGLNMRKINRLPALLLLSIASVLGGTLGLQPPIIFALFLTILIYMKIINYIPI